jgi:catechol 2,3-dioxygenase-like lactoylglutathione lyase family enzyme
MKIQAIIEAATYVDDLRAAETFYGRVLGLREGDPVLVEHDVPVVLDPEHVLRVVRGVRDSDYVAESVVEHEIPVQLKSHVGGERTAGMRVPSLVSTGERSFDQVSISIQIEEDEAVGRLQRIANVHVLTCVQDGQSAPRAAWCQLAV